MEQLQWMTKTGAIITAIAGAIGASGQLLPYEPAQPWMQFIAILLGGIGAALMGQGIRRNVPTRREDVKPGDVAR